MRTPRIARLSRAGRALSAALIIALPAAGCTETPIFELPTDWDSLVQMLQTFAIDFARQAAAAWLF